MSSSGIDVLVSAFASRRPTDRPLVELPLPTTAPGGRSVPRAREVWL